MAMKRGFGAKELQLRRAREVYVTISPHSLLNFSQYFSYITSSLFPIGYHTKVFYHYRSCLLPHESRVLRIQKLNHLRIIILKKTNLIDMTRLYNKGSKLVCDMCIPVEIMTHYIPIGTITNLITTQKKYKPTKYKNLNLKQLVSKYSTIYMLHLNITAL